MIGGAHVTYTPNDLLKDCDADYIVRGRGEICVQAVVCHIRNSKFPVNVDVWRSGNQCILSSKERRLYSPRLDLVDSSLFPDYLSNISVSFSHGCCYNCSFCVVGSSAINTVVFMPIEAASNMISHLCCNYGITGLAVTDENLFFNIEYLFYNLFWII